MIKIVITYATDYGNTKKLAESIASGSKTLPEAEVIIKVIDEVTADEISTCDALIVGTPVHMGSPDWRIKKMIDTICSHLWMKDKLVGKVGGVFATGGGFGCGGGGCELSMLALLNNFAELGLVIVPLPKNTPGYRFGGLQWGPYARSMGINMEQTGISNESLEAAFHHGANIARVAKALKGTTLFAKAEATVATHEK
ncbi:MAG: NAD(P)H-dependent oxidoreductase [Parachlamydiaceae bacterium]|nr:NAD(P)H-dependent oxidoreductase [Parachlamydiaceae bacterium]